MTIKCPGLDLDAYVSVELLRRRIRGHCVSIGGPV